MLEVRELTREAASIPWDERSYVLFDRCSHADTKTAPKRHLFDLNTDKYLGGCIGCEYMGHAAHIKAIESYEVPEPMQIIILENAFELMWGSNAEKVGEAIYFGLHKGEPRVPEVVSDVVYRLKEVREAEEGLMLSERLLFEMLPRSA